MPSTRQIRRRIKNEKQKTFVGIALLIVVLVLGIAYAATTINLSITGTATANFADGNYKVAFTGTSTTEGKGTIEALVDEEATSATLNVSGLTTKDEVATAKFTVKNYSSELASDIVVTTQDTDTEYFDVAAVLDETSLDAGGETTVTVTVKLLKTPISEVTTTINVGLTATAKGAGATN